MNDIKKDHIALCIMASVLCGVGSIFYILETYITASYIMTATTKILFFGLIPIIYFTYKHNRPLKRTLYLNSDIGQIKGALLLGISILVIILMTYHFLKAYIDLDVIAKQLITSADITPRTFPLIAVYIIFGNSFLEEYFFRGYIFLTLYEKGHKKLAYIFSALLFSVYHVAIFKTWFNWGIILLALIGLFIGGLIFNAINTKSRSIIYSWIIHIFADIAIIVIGIKMFYFSVSSL